MEDVETGPSSMGYPGILDMDRSYCAQNDLHEWRESPR
jgi:hypothetical protein